jgi:hypothetical protein
VTPLICLLLRGLDEQMRWLWPEHGRPTSSVLLFLGGLLGAAGVEGCKMAALRWLCERPWEKWAPLGAAFGVLEAVGVFVSWALARQTLGPLAPFSATLFIAAANALLLHLALGRLAAGVAHPPGGPWLAFGLASCVYAVLATGPAALLMLLPEPPAPLLEHQPSAMFVVLLGLALLVRRRVRWPAEASDPGPAREFLAGAGFLILVLALVTPAAKALLAPDWAAGCPQRFSGRPDCASWRSCSLANSCSPGCGKKRLLVRRYRRPTGPG